MEPILLVLTNLPDSESARSLACRLVQSRLAACVNLMPGVQSIYHWQGVVEQATEVTLLIKTTQRQYHQLEQEIVANHPYEVPEVIALPVTDGHAPYLHWVIAGASAGTSAGSSSDVPSDHA
jgi:periplasmic divalent cation tolerance protein